MDTFDFEQPPVRDGLRLHQEVPAERWCVTRQDLAQLRGLVRRHVAQGRVAPTALDGFSVSDQRIGPNVYTVTEQLITPITRRAGQASWALMLRPEGLLCDLFVTHCWAEGLYEFVDKLLHSWPAKAHHAYCCMLSNPQCLDIGGLISSPRESPFARALHAAPRMLVVPNRAGSIYARVWCVYEAFLAYSESKVILTASPPVPGLARNVACACLTNLASASATLIICVFVLGDAGVSLAEEVGFVLLLVSFGLLVVAWSIRPSAVTLVIECASLVGSGIVLGMSGYLLSLPSQNLEKHQLPQFVLLLCEALALCASSVVAEADRLQVTQAQADALQLHNGYTGSIRDAASSVPEDKDTIMEEIATSGVEEDVAYAIDVLLVAGASTPAMRRMMLRTGLVEQAAYTKVSFAVFVWVTWVALAVCRVFQHVDMLTDWCAESLGRCRGGVALEALADPNTYLAAWIILAALTWLLIWLAIPRDAPGRRSFAVRVMVGFTGAAELVVVILLFLLDLGGALSFLLFALASVPAPALSAAGPERLAEVPELGPRLVRLCLDGRCCVMRWPQPAAAGPGRALGQAELGTVVQPARIGRT